MSMPQSRSEINSQQIQKMLDENAQILKAIMETQNSKGKSMDMIQYQQVLHRNLMYLAGLADPNADLNAILPSPGGSNLLQSQRAPPPNQTLPQNMTPPPSTMTGNGGMNPVAPNVTAGMGQTPPPPQWTNPPSTVMPPQSQYNMKGYAPAPWMGNPQGMAAYGANIQQRMQMDEHRRRQLLRMHQERLMRSRQMQQSPSAGMMTRGMYPGQVPPGGGYMGPPPTQPGMGQPQFNQQAQGGGGMQAPPPNMSLDM